MANLYEQKTIRELIENLDEIAQVHRIIDNAEELLSQLKDAETGQRGFLLTGDPSYLKPYEQSLTAIPKLIKLTKEISQDIPIQRQYINQLESLVQQKLHELSETIQLHKDSKISEALLIVKSNAGKKIMDDIRETVIEMNSQVEVLQAQRLNEVGEMAAPLKRVITVSDLLLLIVLLLIALLMMSETSRHELNTLASKKKLEFSSTHDELTELYNRRALGLRLNDVIDSAIRYRRSLSLLLLDIDHFKLVNDTYGHLVGDLVLKRIATVLEYSVRKSDTAARFGGEEFVVILTETALSEAKQFAENLRKAIEEQSIRIDNGDEISVTVSIGLASFPEHAKTSEALLNNADFAMYAAKIAGRNQIKIFGPTKKKA